MRLPVAPINLIPHQLCMAAEVLGLLLLTCTKSNGAVGSRQELASERPSLGFSLLLHATRFSAPLCSFTASGPQPRVGKRVSFLLNLSSPGYQTLGEAELLFMG